MWGGVVAAEVKLIMKVQGKRGKRKSASKAGYYRIYFCTFVGEEASSQSFAFSLRSGFRSGLYRVGSVSILINIDPHFETPIEVNVYCRHAACPVLAGNKWVSNFWIHERGQEFTRPCSTDPFE